LSLSSRELDAFFAVARTRNFSRAAKELHITQSALTQRVQGLEETLGLTLFVRNPRGVTTTPAGERLLRYCQARSGLEAELVADLSGGQDEGLGGTLRLAAYSTVLRSVVIPALAPLLRANPKLQPHFLEAELRDLPEKLLHGEADYVVIDRPLARADLETLKLGEEENVLVTSARYDPPEDLFLDHDVADQTTIEFFAAQGKAPPNLRRGFYDDVYGIIEGVAMGLGRAVIPRHVAAAEKRLEIVRGYRSVKVPVHLQYFKQPFYTKLHEAVIDALAKRAGKLL
jgi:DNA-binding transcriptional LysR family regulator